MKKKPTPHTHLSHGARGAAITVVSPDVEASRGIAALERSDYVAAIQAWQRLRRAGPSGAVDRCLAEAHFRRALTLPHGAHRRQELQEAAARVPTHASYQFHLGLAYLHDGQTRRAAQALEEARRIAPDDVRVLRHLALALLADPATPAQALGLVGQASTRNEDVARLEALACLRLRKPAEAVAVLKALKNPSPLANLALGLAHLAAGRAADAVEHLSTVWRSNEPVAAEALQAATIACVAAHVRARDITAAVLALSARGLPTDATLRRAHAAVCRRLAVELLLDERAEQAIDAWERSLLAEPGHKPTMRCLGHIHEVLGTRAAGQGDFTGAAGHWEAALTYQPGSTRILHNLALAEERQERWEAASDRWEALIRHWKKELQILRRSDPAAAERRRQLSVAFRHLAATYEAAGDLAAATRTLEHALNLEPSDVELRLRTAELYLDNEEYGGATGHLRHVLAARPNDHRVLLELGTAHAYQGDDRRAMEYLEKALALVPEDQATKEAIANVHNGRARRLADLGEDEHAVVEFERAVELAPHDSLFGRDLGAMYLDLGRRADAERVFGRTLDFNPNDASLRSLIGVEYLHHGDEKKAAKLFREATRLDPTAFSSFAIGMAYIRAGKHDKAKPYLKRVLAEGKPPLLCLIGQTLSDLGQPEVAIPYLERAVELDPANLTARMTLALVYTLGLGDYDRASAELTVAEGLATQRSDRETLDTIATARTTIARLSAAGSQPAPLWPLGIR